ncbi:MAG: RNA polymerase sigma factor [Bacteroidales bacterium]|jgi:RNA polymerase sigma-70 factor (ECF subfamily)|nr:RNA polymerase sigma factor [Bacteroidales bacterium]
MTDIELAKKIEDKDPEAFRLFFEENKLKIANLCYGMVHNRDVAEDLVQDIFVEVYCSIKYFKGKSKLSTWLYRIALNKTISYLRKEKVRSFLTPLSNVKTGIASNERQDLSIEEEEKIDLLHKIIDTLSSKQKQAITLFIYDELPQKEIAEIMNCSVASVEVLIHRAKKTIKKKAEKIYGNTIE